MITLRDATAADLPGILFIYNDAVLNTTAIWNETPVDLTNREQWLADRQQRGYPVLVAVETDSDMVLGYASFGDWRAFEGFRNTVEHSVYVHPDARGKGIGRMLMRELIQRARQIGKHVMVAGIEANNLDSLKLHQDLGFTQTALMPQVGVKFGRWLDLAFLQLQLDDGAAR
jgi:phosphinothricin acetyltransferase